MIASTTVNVTMTVTVPDAHVLELIDCAGVGIAYWADRGVVDELARTYRVRPDAEARLDPDMRERTLKFGWIAKRLVQLGTRPDMLGFAHGSLVAGYARTYVGAVLAGDDDATSIFDADLADAVIQLAFFDGKVVFG